METKKNKRLKDLCVGDKIWWLNNPDTTLITVTKVERKGSMVCLTISWDEEEFIAYGSALGKICCAHDKQKEDIMFTCDITKTFEQLELRNNSNGYKELQRVMLVFKRMWELGSV